MRLQQGCRLLGAVGGLVLAMFCAGCFSNYEFIHAQQPEFVVPPAAQTEFISPRDLQVLEERNPEVHRKLLKNIRAYKVELKQWRRTSELYNRGVRQRNGEARRRVME